MRVFRMEWKSFFTIEYSQYHMKSIKIQIHQSKIKVNTFTGKSLAQITRKEGENGSPLEYSRTIQTADT